MNGWGGVFLKKQHVLARCFCNPYSLLHTGSVQVGAFVGSERGRASRRWMCLHSLGGSYQHLEEACVALSLISVLLVLLVQEPHFE